LKKREKKKEHLLVLGGGKRTFLIPRALVTGERQKSDVLQQKKKKRIRPAMSLGEVFSYSSIFGLAKKGLIYNLEEDLLPQKKKDLPLSE